MDKKAHDDAPLPRGDTRRYYPSPESRELARDLTFIARKGRILAKKTEIGLGTLNDDGFARAVDAYAQVASRAARVSAYLDIALCRDEKAAELVSPLRARLGLAVATAAPFARALLDMDEAELMERMNDPRLARHAPWLGSLRAMKAHTLSLKEEEYIAAKAPVAEEGWRRFYDATMDGLSIEAGGRKMTFVETDRLLKTSPDRGARRTAWTALAGELSRNARAFALVANTLAEWKKADDARRKYETPESAAHARNRFDAGVVDAFMAAARADDPKSAHRYYAWKARKSGRARLHPADRLAPLQNAEARTYGWDAAKDIVVSAFRDFSPRLGALAQKMFDEDRVDAAPRPSKEKGAHAFSVPDDGPFIVTSFGGSSSDVLSLARETGRAVFFMLAGKRDDVVPDASPVLPETAASVGEALAFRVLLSRETDLPARRDLLAARVEDMLGAVSRQAALHAFEKKFHEEYREGGEVPLARISALWTETQRESRGPSVDMDAPGAGLFWAAVPHIFHDPFRVYVYALDDILAARVLAAHAETGDKAGFADRYAAMLARGGAPARAFRSIGLDIAADGFWEKGLTASRHVDALLEIDAVIEAGRDAPPSLLRTLFGEKAAANDTTPLAAPVRRRMDRSL